MVSNYRESRKHLRRKVTDTFVVNRENICQIFNLSSGGVSFGCTVSSKIPQTLTVDIVDNTGVHLFDIPLKKVWLNTSKQMETSSMYEVVLGAKFGRKLSHEEQVAIDKILESF